MRISEIQAFYPHYLHSKSSFLLREYLQYKILELIFQSEYAQKFSFLGGTCLRLIHNTQRFSEDLDFDNFDLSEEDFTAVSKVIKKGLEAQGYEVEIRNAFRNAYHCYVRFPGILYENELSGHKEAKIAINLDTEPQHFHFTPDLPILQKFDVFTKIISTPIDILLSQKINAITGRKRPKGRDFYDTTFLFGRTAPNYDYLKVKLDISNEKELKKHLLKLCEAFNFEELAKDVEPFLFKSSDVNQVFYFKEFIEQKLI